MRVRFAPSPTGQLHVGNARTALFNWLLARGSSGTFILRIEDTDVERSTREFENAIIRDLRWLGLDWDEGPDIGGSRGPYRQSERLHLYQSYAQELLTAGHAYYCFCSTAQLEAERQDALAAGRSTRYAGTCRRLSTDEALSRIAGGEHPAIRFKVPPNHEVMFNDAVRGEVRFHTDVIGDPVIVRAGGHPAYNFAVVVDDALMEVTHVIRGEDHISNTPRQILVYEALGFTAPAFAHLALVMGPDHSPLSKRHGATSVAEFRARGYLPEALVNYLALVGWSPRDGDDAELMPVEELARRFSLDRVGHSAGVFDEEKLAWVNRHYLKAADPIRLAELSVPFFIEAGVAMDPDQRGIEFLALAMAMASSSVDRLDQVPGRVAFLFGFSPERALEDSAVRGELATAGARAVVEALAQELAGAPRLDRDRFRAVAHQVQSRTGQKGRALFHPIRIALTALSDGPELDLAVPAIDRGVELPESAGMPNVVGNRERAAAFARALAAVGP
ncbi:MAG TPA: glutamate--tRNA ligase [Vicinamibacterales bacterium]|jgi:glutamyl-tRNA synthetase|nr:glutamate--tRNA ligase [Vicinamibacterales bacterium]